LRSGPSTSYPVISSLSFNDNVTVIESYTNGWKKVEYKTYSNLGYSPSIIGFVAGNYISNSNLLSYLKAIDSKHTLLIADACFSGALFSDAKRGYADNVGQFKSRWGFTSGSLEYVSDGSAGGNSPFARNLIEFLKNNSQEKLEVSTLIQNVKIKVGNETNQKPIGSPLKNVGDEGGEFIFELKK
jgi:hypothetical protein